MKRSLLAATALSTTVTFLVPGAALAQSFDWSGFYAGVGIGGGQSHSTLQFDYDGSEITLPTGPVEFTGGGSMAGGTLGYNWQTGTIVLGVEADARLLQFRGSLSGGPLPFEGYTAEERITALTSMRARLGYASDRFLFFGTAGLAAGQASFNSDVGKGVLSPDSESAGASGTVTGTVVGAGVEYAVNDNMSVKLQGLSYNLSSLSGSGDTGLDDMGKGDPYSATYTPRPMVFEAGVNFHF